MILELHKRKGLEEGVVELHKLNDLERILPWTAPTAPANSIDRYHLLLYHSWKRKAREKRGAKMQRRVAGGLLGNRIHGFATIPS